MTADRSVTVEDTVTLSERVSVTKRSYYSIGWLTTAGIVKTHADEVGGGTDRPQALEYDRLRAYVLSAVTASTAFLEAHVNELFEDAAEYLASPTTKALPGLDREVQIRLAALWPPAKKFRVMDKYEVALVVAEVDPLDRGAEPAQSAADLLQVRNHYLHYQPASVRNGVAQGGDKKLSDRLRTKFTLPEWDNGGEDLFPTRAICPDLARWAVESAVRYADAFCDRIGVKPRYDHVRPEWLR